MCTLLAPCCPVGVSVCNACYMASINTLTLYVGPRAPKGSSLVLRLCCHHVEILNFTFELVHWARDHGTRDHEHVSRRDTYNTGVNCSRVVFARPREHRILMNPQCVDTQRDASDYGEACDVYDYVGAQPKEAMLFVQTRSSFGHRKKGSGFLRNTDNQGTYYISSYSRYFPVLVNHLH